MLTKAKYEEIRNKTIELFDKAAIVLTQQEKDSIKVVDYCLNDIEVTGIEYFTYVETERCWAKELVLLPNQTCPEHYHPPLENYIGKEETFRVRYGLCYLYVEGEPAAKPKTTPPAGDYTVFHEIVLNPGEQYTLMPNTKHWFQAGKDGAIISEFSTKSYDAADVFTDKRIG